MTLNATAKWEGDKALQRMAFNCLMQYPGSFRIEIRTEAKGKGELLASEKGISSQGYSV
jgi:hypothetical protein